jgi:hypothetical protein
MRGGLALGDLLTAKFRPFSDDNLSSDLKGDFDYFINPNLKIFS